MHLLRAIFSSKSIHISSIISPYDCHYLFSCKLFYWIYKTYNPVVTARSFASRYPQFFLKKERTMSFSNSLSQKAPLEQLLNSPNFSLLLFCLYPDGFYTISCSSSPSKPDLWPLSLLKHSENWLFNGCYGVINTDFQNPSCKKKTFTPICQQYERRLFEPGSSKCSHFCPRKVCKLTHI